MLKRLFSRTPPVQPRVSVVIPLFNHAAFIAEAVESVLAQGPILRELIVIDDGSTDDSPAIMERLAARDPRIAFARQPNAGAHATINRALARCTGDILAILNSDDAFAPNRLSTLVAALDADPAAAAAASALSFMDGEGRATANPWYEEARAFHAAGNPLSAALLNGNFVMTTSNLVIRREAFAAIGPFAAFRYVHDLDWLLRALATGHRVLLHPTPLLRYRTHATNTIAEDHGRVRAEWALAAAAFLHTLWDRPGAPPPDWDLAAVTTEILRRHALDRAVPPAMAYLRRAPLDAVLADPGFTDRLRSWV